MCLKKEFQAKCISSRIELDMTMGNGTSDAAAIDEAIEQFEDHWSIESENLIEQVASKVDVTDSGELLAELVRVDIDRRYSAGADVDLQQYSNRFPELFARSEHACAICYEDFRARQSARRPCVPARWMNYSGVSSQKWFQELLQETHMQAMDSVLVDHPTTASLLSSQHDFPTVNIPKAADTGVGQTIGDFELLAFLGKGAFSRVFLARQRSLGRRFVAIKVVDRPMQEQFHLARLQHTGVVPLFSCHEFQGRWVLCMPYSGALTVARWMKDVEQADARNGQSLVAAVQAAQLRLMNQEAPETPPPTQQLPTGDVQPVLDDALSPVDVITDEMKAALTRWHAAGTGPLRELSGKSTPEIMLWLFQRMARALAHAHERGIVHGDLKPANILLRNDGEPALIDFNLSRHTQNRPKSWMGGTMPYFCREQFQQLRDRTAGAAKAEYDIHALGVIMFELLEGRYPFEPPKGNSDAELDRVIAEQAAGVVFRRSNATAGIQAIVRKCLAAQSADKYRNAAELAEDLRRELENLPLRHAAEPVVQSRLRKVIRRYPRVLTGGVIATIAALIIGGMGVKVRDAREKTQRLAAVEQLDRLRDVSTSASELFAIPEVSSDADDPITPQGIADRAMQALRVQEPGAFAGAWQSLRSQLTAVEQTEAEELLFSISMALAQATPRTAGDTESAANQSVPFLSTIFELLPERMRESQFAKYFSGAADVSEIQVASLVSDIRGSSSEEQLMLAMAMIWKGMPDRALEILQSASPSTSYWPVYWTLIGWCQNSLGQFESAATSYGVALSVTDRNPDVLFSRGICLVKSRKLDDAEKAFSALVSDFPDHFEYLLQRARVRQMLHHYEHALEDIDSALVMRPDSVRCQLARVSVLRSLDRNAEANKALESAMQLNPEGAADTVAQATLMIGTAPQEALEGLQNAELKYGPQPQILQPMAHIYSEQMSEIEESIAVLDRLLAENPMYPLALAGRAVLHARNGNWASAEADLDVLERHSGLQTNQIRYQMASAYAVGARQNPELQEPALRWLARAVTGGYGRRTLDRDPDLQSIQGTERFQSIMRVANLLEKTSR